MDAPTSNSDLPRQSTEPVSRAPADGWQTFVLSPQYELGPARQLTFDGREEPVRRPLPEPRADEPEDGGTGELWDRQRELAFGRASRAARRAAADGSSLILNKGATITGGVGREACETRHVPANCADGHLSALAYTCTGRHCTNPLCQKHASRERARRAAVYLEAFAGLKDAEGRSPGYGVAVFPAPPSGREALRRPKTLAKVAAACASLVEAVVLTSAGLPSGWRLGIAGVPHPEGDEKPGKWLPHVNLLWPLVAVGPDGERKRLRFTLPQWALDELRRGWAVILDDIGAKTGNGQRCVAFYEFRQSDGERVHARNYFFRSFPGWEADGQRIRYFGAFASRLVSKLPEWNEAKARDEAASHDGETPTCRHRDGEGHECGLPLTWNTLGVPEGWRQIGQVDARGGDG